MKKYLITNNYSYYDDFDFCNICVVDTKERAEELVQEFNRIKESLKEQKVYALYIHKADYEHFSDVALHKAEFSDYIRICVTSGIFELIKDALVQNEIYFEEHSHFDFLCGVSDRNTLHEKLCNNENASLYIEEIEYIEHID